MGDLLDELWSTVSNRFSYLQGLVVVSKGRTLRSAGRQVPAAMVESVCSQAKKIGIGSRGVKTVAFFDDSCVFVFDADPHLVFLTDKTLDLQHFQEHIAPQFAAILQVNTPNPR